MKCPTCGDNLIYLASETQSGTSGRFVVHFSRCGRCGTVVQHGHYGEHSTRHTAFVPAQAKSHAALREACKAVVDANEKSSYSTDRLGVLVDDLLEQVEAALALDAEGKPDAQAS